MNVLKNTKTTKKILIILLALILFNFSCPQVVRAGDVGNWMIIGVGKIFYGLFHGVQTILNDLFIDNELYDDGEVKSIDRVSSFGGADSIIASAENIISGKFLLLEANIFRDTDDASYANEYLDYKTVYKSGNGARVTFRTAIAGWYYSLRNFAIVALLSVLVYVAIRMVLSTIAQDKAKYKTMFKDWLVALCLLFVIHYFMVGILNITTEITKSIGSANGVITSNLEKRIEDNIHNAEDVTEAPGTTDDEDDDVFDWMMDALGDTVIYAATVIMNIIFIAKYAIRSLTIVFLVLLAPISCITYPIDKISDGKAQAYDTWFKEFLYQVIIQPFHLIIYIVLIGSASQLASENLIYAMLCFGVMIPAEKFIKQMFGFKDKLGSPLGAFAGGAVASQLMSSLKSVGKGRSGGKDNESDKTDNLPPNTKTVNLPGTDGSEDGGATPRDAGNTPETTEPQGGELPEGSVTEAPATEEPPAEASAPSATEEPPAEASVTEEPPAEASAPSATEEPPAEASAPSATEEPLAEESTTDPQQQGASQQTKKPGAWERAGIAVNSRASQHYLRKYGTTSLGLKDAKNRLKNKDFKGAASSINKGIIGRAAKRGIGKAYAGSKNLGRKAIKGATTLGGALALGAFGAMFGQGKEMAMVGAGLGGKLGSSITNKTDKVTETVEGYVGDAHNAFWEKSEQIDKDKFKENKNNIRLARENYRDRHDGVEPKGKELNAELERMYLMDSHGIKKDQFNDVLSDFEMYANPEGEYNLSEREAMDTAMSSALQAQVYSAKDFKDEKTMKQAYKDLLDQYEPYIRSGKMKQEEADKKIRQILTGGARMKGVKGTPPLPRMEEFTITVPTARQALNIPELLGVSGSSDLTDEKIERLNTLTFKLQEKGYTPEEISNLARGNADSRAQSIYVMDRYIAQAEFLTDEKVKDSARAYIAAGKGIDVKDVEEKEVKVEMQERLELFEVGVKKEDLDGIRVLEDEVYKHHRRTDKERALGLTSKYSVAEMHEVGKMNRAIESHAKELVKEGVVTGNGKKEALEHFERAALYKGTELAHTIVVE